MLPCNRLRSAEPESYFCKAKFDFNWASANQFSVPFTGFIWLYFAPNPCSQQIIYYHLTDVKMLRFVLVYFITTLLLVFDYPKFQQLLFNARQSGNVTVKSAGTKVDL